MITVDLGLKLQNIKLGNKDDAQAHFIQLSDLQEQLASMGKTLDDDEYASILLGSLPPSYSSVIGGLNAAADSTGNTITLDQVKQLISDEYDRCMICKGKNGPEEAFATTQKQHDKRNVKCFNCHKMGHYKSDCWAKGGDKEGQCPSRRNDSNSSNDNCGNRNRSNHNQNNRGSNNQNNHNSDSHSEDANTANTQDIEAWATIEEFEDDVLNIPAIYTTEQPIHQPEVEIELYDLGASRHTVRDKTV